MSQEQASISIVIVTYNGQDFMPGLFESIQEQTLQPSEVVAVENSPNNATVSTVQQCYPQATIIMPGENLDFSRGYNLGIQNTSAQYICIVNQDVVLAPNALELLYERLKQNERAGAVAPKLRRLGLDGAKTTIVDGMGITGTISRRFTNIGEGEEDTGQFDGDVFFGISGTAILFSRTALTDIAEHGGGGKQEYFDDDFVAYKDDVDLSYRLRHRGWSPVVVPEAIMYHQRTAQELKQSEMKGVRKDRNAKSLRIRANSWRNHLWVLIKNEPLSNLLIHSPWILWYELRKLIFILLFEQSTLRAIPSFLKGLPSILRKRKAILSSSTISSKELRKWFT